MINVLISKVDHEKINVFRFEEIISDKGGTKKVATSIATDLIVTIQPSGSLNSVGGQQIVNSIAGKTGKAVYLVYSPKYKLQEKDLIVRDDGIIYEIQHVEKNGRGTILQHEKYYIVKYDNQKVLKNG